MPDFSTIMLFAAASVVLTATPGPDIISDKSLDEVILAYLSQGDAKE